MRLILNAYNISTALQFIEGTASSIIQLLNLIGGDGGGLKGVADPRARTPRQFLQCRLYKLGIGYRFV